MTCSPGLPGGAEGLGHPCGTTVVIALGRAVLPVPEAGAWAGGTLLWAPSTSLPGHQPFQMAAERAQTFT